MNASQSNNWKYLGPKPGSNYRQLFVHGRIATWILHGMYVNDEEPMTPEEIAADYGLPLEAVHEAIAYCESEPPEMQSDWEMEERLMEATGMNDPNYKYHGQQKRLTPQEWARLTDR